MSSKFISLFLVLLVAVSVQSGPFTKFCKAMGIKTNNPQIFDKVKFLGLNYDSTHIKINNENDRKKFKDQIQKEMSKHYCPKNCKVDKKDEKDKDIFELHLMCKKAPLLKKRKTKAAPEKEKNCIKSENIFLNVEQENLILELQNLFRDDVAKGIPVYLVGNHLENVGEFTQTEAISILNTDKELVMLSFYSLEFKEIRSCLTTARYLNPGQIIDEICEKGGYSDRENFIKKSHENWFTLLKYTNERKQILQHSSFAIGCAMREWTKHILNDPSAILYCQKIVCTYSTKAAVKELRRLVSACNTDENYKGLCAKEEIESYFDDSVYNKYEAMPRVALDWFHYQSSLVSNKKILQS